MSPRRILLAEDTSINQRVAVEILEGWGHQVVVADDGRRVVDLALQEPFDLVLMDLQMPRLDGLQATKVIRNRERPDKSRLPIVAMTAAAMKGDRERCLASGMDDYISKPFDLAALRQIIAKYPARGSHAKASANASPPNRGAVAERAAGQGDSGRIDWESARRATGDKDSLLADLIRMFREDCPAILDQMEVAFASSNREELQRLAHSLRGIAVYFGTTSRVTTLLLHLERHSLNGDLDELNAVFRELTGEANLLMAELENGP